MTSQRLGCENCAAPYIVEFIQKQLEIINGLELNLSLSQNEQERHIFEERIESAKSKIRSRHEPLKNSQASCRHCHLKV